MVNSEFSSYIDDKYAVLNGTIISTSVWNTGLEIPAYVGRREIKRIGDGLYYNDRYVSKLYIKNGIEQIGMEAFANCSNLLEIYIPETVNEIEKNAFFNCNKVNFVQADRVMSRNEYETLKNTAINFGANKYLITRPHSEIKSLKCVYDGLEYIARPAARIDAEMKALMRGTRPDKAAKLKGAADEQLTTFLFDGRMERKAESTLFLETIRENSDNLEALEDNNRLLDEKTVEINDEYVRRELMPPIEKTFISIIYDDQTVIDYDRDRVTVKMQFYIGYFFWQSANRVVWKNYDYFVYRREYLTSDDECSFFRYDMDVYGKGYTLTDQGIAESVFAKYRLLSLL